MRLKEEILFAKNSEGALIVDLATDEFFELNSSGTRIVELLMNCTPTAQIVEALQSEFEAPPNGEAEIKRFLSGFSGLAGRPARPLKPTIER